MSATERARAEWLHEEAARLFRHGLVLLAAALLALFA